MSDPELATKAPESDAFKDAPSHQPSAISTNDSLAQTGISMGDHCTTDRPLPSNSAQPSGTTSILSSLNIDTYISKPADYPSTPSKLLLLLTSGTGFASPNNRLQADAFAAEGFLVVMPDMFAGDPAPSATNRVTSPISPTDTEEKVSIIEQVKLKVAETAKVFSIDMWLARQTPERILPRIHAVLDTIKDEYADAIAHGGGIYAVGYCFGARYVLILGGGDQAPSESQAQSPGHNTTTTARTEALDDNEATPAITKTKPLIKAAAVAHPTNPTRSEISSLSVPTTMACVENDPLFPDELLEHARKCFASSSVEHEVEVYEGVPHGFAVKGDYPDDDGDGRIKREQERAFGQMVGWLKKH